MAAIPGRIRLPSDAPQEHEDQYDHQHQPQAAAGAVAPIPAISPSGKGAEEEQDQDNQQDRTEHDVPLSMVWARLLAAAVNRTSTGGSFSKPGRSGSQSGWVTSR